MKKIGGHLQYELKLGSNSACTDLVSNVTKSD